MKRALLGLALGGALSRVGLAGSEGVIRGLDGAEPGLLLLGVLCAGLLAWPHRKAERGKGRAIGAGALIGLGVGFIGGVPLSLAASLGEGKLLALPVLAVLYAGWRFGARWDLSETAPAAPPTPPRSADGPLGLETDSAE